MNKETSTSNQNHPKNEDEDEHPDLPPDESLL
jgi:hypothetical protein